MSDTQISDDKILSEILTDDGTFPNNDRLPVVIYKDPLDKNTGIGARDFESLFTKNNWHSEWRYGIYPFHHYHSTAHEVLGVFTGATQVQLGGPNGIVKRVEAGDVIVIPAGIAHQNSGGNTGFKCVGAYANGTKWDMNYGKAGERPQADKNIARVNLPTRDPVYGDHGPLMDLWNLR